MGVGGAFHGWGEWAWVELGLNDHTNYDLYVSSLTPNGTKGWAGCTYLNNHPMRQSDEYIWQQGQEPIDMGSIYDQVCAITAVRGHFAGPTERVNIEDIGKEWVLTGSSQQSYVEVHARCLYYEQ
jgi:hypothetical protein